MYTFLYVFMWTSGLYINKKNNLNFCWHRKNIVLYYKYRMNERQRCRTSSETEGEKTRGVEGPGHGAGNKNGKKVHH